MKRVLLYIFACVQVAIPLFLLAAVGYDSTALFLFHLLLSAGAAFVCCVLAALLRRAENDDAGAETFRAQLASHSAAWKHSSKSLQRSRKKSDKLGI